MYRFYEHFDISLIRTKGKKNPKSSLNNYKGLYYWVLHQALTDKLSHDIIEGNDTTSNWLSFVSALDSRRILGILRPVLEGKNRTQDPKWVELSKALIAQISNLLFIEKSDPSHVIKCISIISRFSSYSLSNGCFDGILLSLHQKEFKNPIDTSHILKGYVKSKRFDPLLYTKLLNCIINIQGSPADRNTAIAIALKAISEYWWHWNKLNFYISDLIRPKDAMSLINIIGNFDISNEVVYKITETTSKFFSKIIENPSNYSSSELSFAYKSLVSMALLNPKNELFILALRKNTLYTNIPSSCLIDILSSHILVGITPPIDLAVKCVIDINNIQCSIDDISKLRLITSATGFSAFGFKRIFKRVISKCISNGKESHESHLVFYYQNGIKSNYTIPLDLKINNIQSIPKFQVLSKNCSILEENNKAIKQFVYHSAFDSSRLLFSLKDTPKWLIEQFPPILSALNKLDIKGFNEAEEIVYNNLEKFSKSNLFIVWNLLIQLLKLSTSNLIQSDIIWQRRYLKTLHVISTLDILNEDISFLRNAILTGLEINQFLNQEFNRCIIFEQCIDSNKEIKRFLKEGSLNILTCIFNEDKCSAKDLKMRSIWNLMKLIAIKSEIPAYSTRNINTEFHPRPMEISLMANLCTVHTPIQKIRHNLYWMLDSSNFPRIPKSNMQFKFKKRPKFPRRFPIR